MRADEILHQLLKAIASRRGCDLTAAADFLVTHEWGEIDIRQTTYPALARILRTPQIDFDALCTWLRKDGHWPFNHAVLAAQLARFLGAQEAPKLVRELIGGCSQSPRDSVIDKFIESAARIAFYSGDREPALSEAAFFASILLTAAFPDEFVDYRITRWQKMAEWFAPTSGFGEADGYPSKMRAAAEIAREVANTSTFRKYFTTRHPLNPRWSVAGLAYLLTTKKPKNELPDIMGEITGSPRGPWAKLSDELLLGEQFFEDVERLLKDKRQVILYGPPGTGKTFVARKLADHFAGDPERVEVIQFHPSYAYEDFVEGYRPYLCNGQPAFNLVQGPLKRLAAKARAAPKDAHILLIDEINRGNIPKIFGELYYLLEYREDAISLLYSAEHFGLPKNLWIIGTMNTADRSIALIDAALRRRFYFVPFFPDQSPVQGLLDRWLGKHGKKMLWLAGVVDYANALLAQSGRRHVAIGPSYFLRPGLTPEWAERIWEHAIMPYLEEQFFGERDQLEQFRLDRLRASAVAEANKKSE